MIIYCQPLPFQRSEDMCYIQSGIVPTYPDFPEKFSRPSILFDDRLPLMNRPYLHR
jgi:hypothetical protein